MNSFVESRAVPPQPKIERFWELDSARVEPRTFFRALARHFPEATMLFVEGTAFAPAVLELLERYRDAGPYLPGANTLWPESRKVRCRAAVGLLGRLAHLAVRHPPPELGDHACLYAEERYLLYWHDMFDNAAYLHPALPRERVERLGAALGCGFRWVEPVAPA